MPASGGSAAPLAASDLSRAREAFLLGLELSRAGQWTDALAEFQRSARLKPHPVTTYNIAYCERSLGLHASAYMHFLLALGAVGASDGERLPDEYALEAQAYVVEAERRVAHVHVLLVAAGQVIRVDGRPIVAMPPDSTRIAYAVGEPGSDSAALPAAFDLWLDPGPHLFSASRTGAPEVVQSRVIAAGSSGELQLGAAPAATAAAPPRAPRPPAPRQPPDRRLAASMLGFGAVSLLGGGLFAALALNDKRDLDARKCPNRACPGPYQDEEAEMKTTANIASVGFALGAIGAAVGSYLFVTAKPRKASEHGVSVEPRIGLGGVALGGRF